jgi:hypothetical protein
MANHPHGQAPNKFRFEPKINKVGRLRGASTSAALSIGASLAAKPIVPLAAAGERSFPARQTRRSR